MERILDITDLAHRRVAAEATAEGAALIYAFGNFCALAGRPDRASVRALNRLKGRPVEQTASVTTTPERTKLVFDWERTQLPWSALVATMADLHTLGPIGFRGPAAASLPDHLTVTASGIRTVQLITPGDVCPSNALVGEVLDLIGGDVLAITSANANGEPAHFELRALQKEFGHRDGVTLIGHRNERANRRRYPRHLPCSTSIVAFHEGHLVLERHGSLDAGVIEQVANRHGLALTLAATERVPVRRSGRPAFGRVRAVAFG